MKLSFVSNQPNNCEYTHHNVIKYLESFDYSYNEGVVNLVFSDNFDVRPEGAERLD